MVWRLAEQANVLHEEESKYPLSSFLSGFLNLFKIIFHLLILDIGGTVGLFLGLNLIAVVQISCNMFHNRGEIYENFLEFKDLFLQSMMATPYTL